VTDHALVSSTRGPAFAEALPHDRSHGPHDRSHGPRRPRILSREWRGGERISHVLRADGSVFTVTVPALGVYDHTEHLAPQHPWISADRGRPELSDVGALRLAAAVAGPPRARPRPVR